MHEAAHGIACVDGFGLRGRKGSEEHLPNLLRDLTAIVDGQSQADPQFRTTRLYTRLTATEVRRQLIAHKGYTEEELPTADTNLHSVILISHTQFWAVTDFPSLRIARQ